MWEPLEAHGCTERSAGTVLGLNSLPEDEGVQESKEEDLKIH